MEQYSLAESQQKTAHHKRIKSGRGWILAVAIIQTIAAVAFYFILNNAQQDLSADEIELASNGDANVLVYAFGAIALIFWGCWFWAKKQPFPAALVALLVFLTIHIADGIMDPQSFFRGIIFKILLVLGLSQAVVSAYKLKKADGERLD